MKVVIKPFKFYVKQTLDFIGHSKNNSSNELKIIMGRIFTLIYYFLLALSIFVRLTSFAWVRSTQLN